MNNCFTEWFKRHGVEINTQGTRHLGAAIGTHDFKILFVTKKVNNWIESVKNLSLIAESEPHAAFSAFTHAIECQWVFLSRVMPYIYSSVEPLELAIRTIFLQSLLKKNVNDNKRDLLALPGGSWNYKPC